MPISRRGFAAGALASAAARMAGAARAAGPQPTKAQADWMKLGYGMFLHFGPNTFAGVNWGDGKFPASGFTPGKLDCTQWAGIAAEAGMKYAVLTTKHLDGFCLWPSKHTEYSVKATRAGDVVGQYAEAFRKAGLRVGFYYSLWDVNQPSYENDAAYAEYMRKQITELLTGYGPIVELWFDGSWDKDHPTKKWPFDPRWEKDPKSGLGHGERYEWKALYELIHKLQPDCLVANNSSSDRPGGVRYLPVDLRTAEHFDFVYEDRLYEPVTEPVFEGKTYLPLEYCTSLNPGWFWKPAVYYTHPSAETIASWWRTARATSANLLLNVGPNRDGLIPEVNARYLRAAAKLLKRG